MEKQLPFVYVRDPLAHGGVLEAELMLNLGVLQQHIREAVLGWGSSLRVFVSALGHLGHLGHCLSPAGNRG